jgi:hypothetical protein
VQVGFGDEPFVVCVEEREAFVDEPDLRRGD